MWLKDSGYTIVGEKGLYNVIPAVAIPLAAPMNVYEYNYTGYYTY